jgi:hypothetical protein
MRLDEIVWQMKRQGATYTAIAADLGMTRQSVTERYHRVLKRFEAEHARWLLAVQMEAYDDLMAVKRAMWPNLVDESNPEFRPTAEDVRAFVAVNREIRALAGVDGMRVEPVVDDHDGAGSPSPGQQRIEDLGEFMDLLGRVADNNRHVIADRRAAVVKSAERERGQPGEAAAGGNGRTMSTDAGGEGYGAGSDDCIGGDRAVNDHIDDQARGRWVDGRWVDDAVRTPGALSLCCHLTTGGMQCQPLRAPRDGTSARDAAARLRKIYSGVDSDGTLGGLPHEQRSVNGKWVSADFRLRLLRSHGGPRSWRDI